MTIPWAPMPKTIEDEEDVEGYATGAIVRARHRQRMVIRWRDKEARDEDRKKRRLPQDWHDWMMCPAEDGYQSTGCTCNLSLSNAPRSMRIRERELRATLERELRIPIKDRLKGIRPEVIAEPVAVAWVKSIDAPQQPESMISLRRRVHDHVAQGPISQTSRLARSGPRTLSVRAPASGKDPARRPERRSTGRLGGSARVRVPSWLSRVGRYLSLLRPTGSTR